MLVSLFGEKIAGWLGSVGGWLIAVLVLFGWLRSATSTKEAKDRQTQQLKDQTAAEIKIVRATSAMTKAQVDAPQSKEDIIKRLRGGDGEA